MIAKRAFFGRTRDRIQKPAAVRTGLNAETAPDAILRIDEHRPVRRVESRADRAGLRAGGMLAEVAKLGHEERVLNLLRRHRRRPKTSHPPLGAVHQRLAPRLRGAR